MSTAPGAAYVDVDDDEQDRVLRLAAAAPSLLAVARLISLELDGIGRPDLASQLDEVIAEATGESEQ